MARYNDSVCRLCRREGMKLFLKGDRCFTDKCSIERRNYPPGQHGQGRPKFSDYGLQLREKQKVRRIYGLLERQFRKTVAEASRMKGVKGENLMALLERRLDNVIFRLGFVTARTEARQLVRHGHFAVNGRFVDVASFSVRPGDVVTVRNKEGVRKQVAESLEVNKSQPVPAWLEVNRDNLTVRVATLPKREDVPHPIQEQLIIELCSK